MEQLEKIDLKDREELLSTSADRLLGKILELNRRLRYHNTLDAIKLTSVLLELKEKVGKRQHSHFIG